MFCLNRNEVIEMCKRFSLSLFALLLLVSCVIFIPSIVAEEGEAKVYVDPPESLVLPGETFDVNICISDVFDLFCWQVVLYYKNNVVSAMDAFEGTFLNETGGTVFVGPVIHNDWNTTHGRIIFGCSLLGQVPEASGSGVLATIKFGLISAGGSMLSISTISGDSYLLDPDLQEMPFEAEDGYVTSGPVPHDVAIISVALSKAEVFAGQNVGLEVISKNVGTTTETFNVTASYNSHIIMTETLTDIIPNEETTLQFVWNTSGVPHGIYTVKVIASVVPGETVLYNNFFLESIITIKPRIDLSVSVEVPRHPTAGQSNLLEASVSNIGWKAVKTNIELQLFVNENIVNETILTRLDPGTSIEVTYLWTPTTEGTYTVKAYAPPVLGEEVTVNNLVNKTVVVSPPEMPTIQVELWRDCVRIGEFVRVHIYVYDIVDLYAWQFKLYYNPGVLEFRSIWLPDNNVFAEKDCETMPVELGGNYVIYGVTLVGGESAFNGSGILCKMDFKAKHVDMDSLLQLDDSATFLLNSVLDKISIEMVHSHVRVYGDTIEITNVETSRTEVYAGWIIEVNVTVKNNGYMPHTFDVTAYFASEVRATKKVYDLPAGEETTLTFCMDTRPLTPYIDYAIWVEATIIVGETWAYNNFFFYWEFWGLYLGDVEGPGLVTTRLIPDINGDAEVDMRDLGFAASAFGSYPEHPRWNLLVDMNQDDHVNMFDIALVARQFGRTY